MQPIAKGGEKSEEGTVKSRVLLMDPWRTPGLVKFTDKNQAVILLNEYKREL